MPRVAGKKAFTSQEELQRRVGGRVAELRALRGWSQEEFGRHLGWTLRHVAALELGEYNVTLATLRRVADALDADVAILFSPPTGLKRGRGRPKKH